MLCRMKGARYVLELGTYTGYAAHCMAEVLPPGGEVHTIESDDEMEDFIRSFIAEAPWGERIKLHLGDALELLPALVERHFAALPVRGISGHSMGGHGAITLALRHPGRYRSVSAFAPICAAAQAPWGRKAFAAYLGDNPAAWLAHDATALIAQPLSERLPLLGDQGEADEFLPQLRPDLLQAACERAGHPLTLRTHAGYDHSYYFMASFMADHMAHHAAALRAP